MITLPSSYPTPSSPIPRFFEYMFSLHNLDLGWTPHHQVPPRYTYSKYHGKCICSKTYSNHRISKFIHILLKHRNIFGKGRGFDLCDLEKDLQSYTMRFNASFERNFSGTRE